MWVLYTLRAITLFHHPFFLSFPFSSIYFFPHTFPIFFSSLTPFSSPIFSLYPLPLISFPSSILLPLWVTWASLNLSHLRLLSPLPPTPPHFPPHSLLSASFYFFFSQCVCQRTVGKRNCDFHLLPSPFPSPPRPPPSSLL